MGTGLRIRTTHVRIVPSVLPRSQKDQAPASGAGWIRVRLPSRRLLARGAMEAQQFPKLTGAGSTPAGPTYSSWPGSLAAGLWRVVLLTRAGLRPATAERAPGPPLYLQTSPAQTKSPSASSV